MLSRVSLLGPTAGGGKQVSVECVFVCVLVTVKRKVCSPLWIMSKVGWGWGWGPATISSWLSSKSLCEDSITVIDGM